MIQHSREKSAARKSWAILATAGEVFFVLFSDVPGPVSQRPSR